MSKSGAERAGSDRRCLRHLQRKLEFVNIQLAGRESLEGVPAILVTFKAKPGYKPKSRESVNSTWFSRPCVYNLTGPT